MADQPSIPPSVPDVYADQFLMTSNAWGVNLTFLRGAAHPAPNQPGASDAQATIRMSLQHAKAMVMLMKKQLKQWERDTGIEIMLPAQVYTGLGIAREDW